MDNNQIDTDLDIFFKLEYGKLYESVEKGTPELFRFERDGLIAQYLYIKRPVPWLIQGEQFFDTVTPYGYGGPVLIHGNPDPSFVDHFYFAWSEYCRNNRIVSEFVRYHLFDNQEFMKAFPGDVRHVSDNVVCLLNSNIDQLWMDFEYKVRKNVKKAQTNGLVVSTDSTGEYLESFFSIYNSTMERNDARSFYYFGKDYFQQIIDTLQGHFMFFHVWKDDVIISTELVLLSEKYVYSFLGGTLNDFFHLRPNDLLKFEIIKWSKESGHKAFILGGGYGGNDGIYRYKKSFSSSNDVPFYVGKKIHNQAIYEELVKIHQMEREIDESFFPIYRC